MKTNVIRIITLASILATSAACASDPKIDSALKLRFPKLTFDSVAESPVKGMYEVVAGGNVFYFEPTSGYVIFGEMWSPKGTSVTAVAHAKIQAAKYTSFKSHLADAVKIGNGPNEVIEVVDPDCPYCRRMYDYWANRTDVTRYVFLMPLPQLHPQAKAHVEYILSAPDQVLAYREVESGKYDHLPVPSIPLKADLIGRQAEVASASGLKGTPAFYINGTFVNGANIPSIEQHLTKKE